MPVPEILPYEAFWIFIIIFFIAALGTIEAGYILSRKAPSPVKEATFECGQDEDIHPHETFIRGADRYFAYAVAFFILDSFTWIIIAAVRVISIYLATILLLTTFIAGISVSLAYYVYRVRGEL